MKGKNHAFVFETKIQDEKAGRFSVPTEICDFFNLKPKERIRLSIENKYNTIYDYDDVLKSGYEIYDEHTPSLFQKGQEIRVVVFHPENERQLELLPYQ